jgi:hypothetical protein
VNRKLVVGLATLIVLGGSAGAIAATQTGASQLAPSSQAYIDDLAGRLNVAPSTLSAAMKAALDDRIDAALAAGRITSDRAAALKARVAAGKLHAARPPAAGRGLRAGANAAEDYLGISAATLRTDLASGKTLAQIAATTPGKTADGLKAAVLATTKSRLDAAVASGAITSAQESTRLARLSARLDVLLSRTWVGEFGVLRPLRPYLNG